MTDLKSHPFFHALDLAEKYQKKAQAWGCGNSKKAPFFRALNKAVPFIFDKATTIEKRIEGRTLNTFENIVEEFSLPFSTSLYLVTDAVTLQAPMSDGVTMVRQTLLGYLIHEITPEKFQLFEVSWVESPDFPGQEIPSINQFEIDFSLIETMNRQLNALRDAGENKAEDRKPSTHVFKETACVVALTKAISVKRVGIEHVRSFSVKSKDVGNGYTSVKTDRLYYIADKVEYDYMSKVERPGVKWIIGGMVRGHWRAFYCKDSLGENLKDQFGRNIVDYNRTGKNRLGEEKIVPGYTWVVEHSRGDEELAEIKTRMVVNR